MVSICIRIKKGESRGKKRHATTMMRGKANEALNYTPVPLRQNAEEKGRGKGLQEVWGDENG
jgi:hypothetical protein